MNAPAKTVAQLVTLATAIAITQFGVLAQSQSAVDPSKAPTATTEVAPAPPAAPSPSMLVLKEGTEVPLVFAAPLSFQDRRR